MSSLKYIFVIEDNQLVRKLRDEATKQTEIKASEGSLDFQRDVTEGADTKHESRNKRNKTSRG